MGVGAITQLGVAHQGNNEANYRTGATVTDRVLFRSESIAYEYDRLADDALQGVAGEMEDAQGVKSSGGGIPVYMNYTLLSGGSFVSADTLLAAALGNATWDSSNGRNQITPVDDLSDYITALIDRDTSLWELVGAFLPSFSLTCAANGRLEADFSTQAYDFINSGLTNSQSDIDDLLMASSPTYIIGKHLTFYLASDFSDALAAGDRRRINQFTINFNRNLSGDEYTTPDSTHTDSEKPIMPVIDGKREVTAEFQIPRYDTDQYHTWKINHTRLQGILEFSSGSNLFKIFMPNVVIDDAPSPVDGSGHISQTVSARLRRRNTAESVMTFEDSTTVDEEIGFELDNERTAAIY